MVLAMVLPLTAAATDAKPNAETSTTAKMERLTATDEMLTANYLAGAWWLYKSMFVESGRVVDRSNGDVSHSEGQGYGMLIAVAADDRETFDALWAWTRENLQVRGDRLTAWKWDPHAANRVADSNNASDGDLLIAWALSRAAVKWQDPALADAVRGILADLKEETVVRHRLYGTLLLPAAKGFTGSPEQSDMVVNLSYWVFPALEELGRVDPSFPADALLASGQRLLKEGRFGGSYLPADWLSIGENGLRPAKAFPSVFGYEAVRIPLYTAWMGGAPLALLEGLQTRWNENGENVMHVMDLDTSASLTSMPDPGYRAVSHLLSCSLGRAGEPPVMPPFEPTEYYPSTLHLLSIIAISERYPSCLPNLN
jgi:endoglucanase